MVTLYLDLFSVFSPKHHHYNSAPNTTMLVTCLLLTWSSLFVLSKCSLILNLESTSVTSYQTAGTSSWTAAQDLSLTRSSSLTSSSFDTTSNYLLGLSAYGGLSNFGSSNTFKKIQSEDNIQVIGFCDYVSEIMPKDDSSRDSCCSSVDGLKELINSGEACSNFVKNSYPYQIWSSNRWLNKSLDNGNFMTPFTYLMDSCDDYLVKDYCISEQSAGGTPDLSSENNREWWTLLFQGTVNCTIQAANGLGNNSPLDEMKFHIWNEANAHFWQDGKSGDYYEYFYQLVVSNLKNKFSDYNLQIGGPVTCNPATDGTTWEDWFLPLFKMNSDDILLDFFDYHGYNEGARWDLAVTNVNLINIYNWIYNKYNIKTSITETNFNLDSSWEFDDDETHWKERTMNNLGQIISLSHYPNKFDMRHQFDFYATYENFQFLDSIDEYSTQILGNLANNLIIKSNLYDTSDGSNSDPFYFSSSNDVMSQVVLDQDTNKIYIYLLNNSTNKVDIQIQDSSSSVQFDTSNNDKENMYATYWGKTTNVNMNQVNNNPHIIKVSLDPISIYQLTGTLVVNSLKESINVEYNCDNTNTIMNKISTNYDAVSFDCNMYLSDSSNLNGKSIVDGYIRVGLVGDAAGRYTWAINAKSNGDSSNNYIGAGNVQYQEIYLSNSNDFIQGLNLNSQVTVSVYGYKSNYNVHGEEEGPAKQDKNVTKKIEKRNGTIMHDTLKDANVPGRLAFVSLVLRFE